MERENDNRTSAQRYVDILTEAGFKAVFGVEKNKDVLIDLLNTGVPRFTPEEKLKYEHDMMTERDYTDILDTCRAEGLAEGETKGRKEERLRIAKAMIEKGMDTSTVVSVTGLSIKDIAGLRYHVWPYKKQDLPKEVLSCTVTAICLFFF